MSFVWFNFFATIQRINLRCNYSFNCNYLDFVRSSVLLADAEIRSSDRVTSIVSNVDIRDERRSPHAANSTETLARNYRDDLGERRAFEQRAWRTVVFFCSRTISGSFVVAEFSSLYFGVIWLVATRFSPTFHYRDSRGRNPSWWRIIQFQDLLAAQKTPMTIDPIIPLVPSTRVSCPLPLSLSLSPFLPSSLPLSLSFSLASRLETSGRLQDRTRLSKVTMQTRGTGTVRSAGQISHQMQYREARVTGWTYNVAR